LQDHVFLMRGNVSWCTRTRVPHESSQIPNIYGYVTLSCKQQAEAYAIIRNFGEGAARYKKDKRLQHGGHACDRSSYFSCCYS